jgi:hypothetical protein
MPTGETPTGAAIRGGCGYAGQVQRDNPRRVVSMLLVTDGVPEAPVSMSNGCVPTLADAEQAATDCRTGSPAIDTYVVGVGPSLDNLAHIAEAGGSNMAYLVESGDVSAQVLAALDKIRGSASIPCQLKIPPAPDGRALDYGQINVLYTDPQGNQSGLYNVGTAAGCDAAGGGWYYDDASAPQKIILCDATCSVVRYETGGTLDYALGCSTVIPPIR